MNWTEASAEARKLLASVSRGRVAASEPGVEWSYLDWGGDGELVTLLHANGFCAATLAPVAAGLRDRFRVLAFDVRGHGDSTAVPVDEGGANYSWSRLSADYAAALSNRMKEIGADRVRYGIGHSFGGILSLGAAASMPGRFEELLLLDPVILPPVTPGEPDPHQGGNAKAVMSRRRRAAFPSHEAAFDHFSGRGLFRDFPPEALALYVSEGLAEVRPDEVHLKCAPSVEAAIFEGGRSIDSFELAPLVDARTTILHAAKGNFSRAVYDDFAAAMPDAQVRSCDGGHLFPMERPDLVLDAVLD